ncbi:MAG: SDR family NAD(P)-dependent oxidoreductase [Legionella sp.]|uniref:SDR family NAD(P)-dependent oxidoreductase n=1 Tax=Legionella sp. TaxID=459 RepID=UPI0039E50056
MFIITGGGSGIGRALALSLVERGKKVLIIGRREQLLRETVAFGGANINYLQADVASTEGLNTIKNHLNNVSHIDALINNAGTLQPLVTLHDVPADEWQNALNTNLNAALYLPQMLYEKLTLGRVLNIGSGAAYFAMKGWGAYCVTKAALAMLTKCWQLESKSVAFASVMPGIIDTHMQELARSHENPDDDKSNFYQRLKEHGRLISPDIVALFLTWLLLDVDTSTFISKEWDIYDNKHHSSWLKPPHQVLHWDF